MNMEEIDHIKDEIKNLIINDLLDYVRDGIMSKNTNHSFIQCYNIIMIANDNNCGEELVKFHNEVIVLATTECYEKIKNLYGIELIDNFVLYTERLNIMIFYMDRSDFLLFIFLLFKFSSTI